MRDELGPNLDKLLPQLRQRPVFDFLRQGQGTHEIGQIARQSIKLEPDLVVAEPAARQPGPPVGVLAFLDPLFRRAPLIIEGDDPFGWTAQVGQDEADTKIQVAEMPFDLGTSRRFLSLDPV